MEFYEDLRRETKERLNALGIPYDANADKTDLLKKLFNIKSKRIKPANINIHKSKEFVQKQSTLNEPYKTDGN